MGFSKISLGPGRNSSLTSVILVWFLVVCVTNRMVIFALYLWNSPNCWFTVLKVMRWRSCSDIVFPQNNNEVTLPGRDLLYWGRRCWLLWSDWKILLWWDEGGRGKVHVTQALMRYVGYWTNENVATPASLLLLPVPSGFQPEPHFPHLTYLVVLVDLPHRNHHPMRATLLNSRSRAHLWLRSFR